MASTAGLRLRGRDRRRRRRWVIANRRSGFDRRRHVARGPAGMVEQTLRFLRDHPRALAALLVLGNVLNLMDLLLTLHALDIGLIRANPLMPYFLAAGSLEAGLVKLGVGAVATVAAWQLRDRRAALLSIVLAVAFHGLLVVYEIVALALLS